MIKAFDILFRGSLDGSTKGRAAKICPQLSLLLVLLCAVFMSGCEERHELQIMIPLYSYPNWYEPTAYIWDDVAAANSDVRVTAIINPDNGPGGCPLNSDYQQGVDHLTRSGVTVLGYIYTEYGERNMSGVQADIDAYHQCVDIAGIFFDAVSPGEDKLDYYMALNQYVKSLFNGYQVALNPGTHISEAYLHESAGDIINIFEDHGSNWKSYPPDPYIQNYPEHRFSVLLHGVEDTVALKSYIDLAVERNIGYVYLTDDIMANPWDRLPQFWWTEIDHIKTLNQP